MIETCLNLYIKITGKPTKFGIVTYAKLFSRLSYDQQGELSYLIHQHYHGDSK